MSFAGRREFFFDRSLGKRSARPLLEAGWTVHLIADHSVDDATDIPDAAWIAEGIGRGWILLTKDRRIRYRAPELASLADGLLFCLADGNLGFAEMGERLLAAGPALERAHEDRESGFWHVYAGGRVSRMS